MIFICVAGASSKAGKTLLAEQLIRYCAARYAPVFGVKFTTTSDLPTPCPRNAPCTVCDLSDQYRIVRDPSVILQPGKNTQRLAAANAADVIWVVARKSFLPKAYTHLLSHIPENAVVVMEGSSITSICEPSVLFYVFSNHIAPARWKESAKQIIERSDFVIMNKRPERRDHPQIELPEGSLIADLAKQPVTEFPEIRNKIDSVIGAAADAIHN